LRDLYALNTRHENFLFAVDYPSSLSHNCNALTYALIVIVSLIKHVRTALLLPEHFIRLIPERRISFPDDLLPQVYRTDTINIEDCCVK
jgi:hypothetical protein